MSDSLNLTTHKLANVTLPQSLQQLPEIELVGYLMSPRGFRFIRWRGGRLEGDTLPSEEQVIEARLGCPTGELRWLRNPNGKGEGVAVWLTEEQAGPNDWAQVAQRGCQLSRDVLQLLTGTLAGAHPEGGPGWSLMNAPRHGKVPLPLDARPGERPAMRLREYLGAAPGQAGEDGNQMVIEERLLGLEVIGNRVQEA